MSWMKKEDWQKALEEALEKARGKAIGISPEIPLSDILGSLVEVRRTEMIEECDSLIDAAVKGELTDEEGCLLKYLWVSLRF